MWGRSALGMGLLEIRGCSFQNGGVSGGTGIFTEGNNGNEDFRPGNTDEQFQSIRTSFSLFSFVNQRLFFSGEIRFNRLVEFIRSLFPIILLPGKIGDGGF